MQGGGIKTLASAAATVYAPWRAESTTNHAKHRTPLKTLHIQFWFTARILAIRSPTRQTRFPRNFRMLVSESSQ